MHGGRERENERERRCVVFFVKKQKKNSTKKQKQETNPLTPPGTNLRRQSVGACSTKTKSKAGEKKLLPSHTAPRRSRWDAAASRPASSRPAFAHTLSFFSSASDRHRPASTDTSKYLRPVTMESGE